MKNGVFCIVFHMMFISSAGAAVYPCTGSIENLRLAFNGDVNLISADIYGNQTPRVICSLNGTFYDISGDACSGWLSMLLTARTTHKRIKIEYNDELTCNTQPAYASANRPFTLWFAE